MIITGIRDEDFSNYKEPSMFISAAFCTFKCEKESGVLCCQNKHLNEYLCVKESAIIRRYLSNPITHAIVFGGLEPFDQIEDVVAFISLLRYDYHCDDTVVIYTGYNKTEISSSLDRLKEYKNIIVKFGRFIPDRDHHYDEVLGVPLASPNQYAERIS